MYNLQRPSLGEEIVGDRFVSNWQETLPKDRTFYEQKNLTCTNDAASTCIASLIHFVEKSTTVA